MFVSIQLSTYKYFTELARTKIKKMLQVLHCFLWVTDPLTTGWGLFVLCFSLVMNIMRCLIAASVGSVVLSKLLLLKSKDFEAHSDPLLMHS